MAMTTEDLLAFCGLPDTPKAREYVDAKRGLLEKMEAVCAWDRGEGPLPPGVMIDTKIRGRRWG